MCDPGPIFDKSDFFQSQDLTNADIISQICIFSDHIELGRKPSQELLDDTCK